MLVRQAGEAHEETRAVGRSFVTVMVVLVAAGCVRGGPSQETTTDERTTQGASAALFEVTTSHPDYWRLFTMDRVDGRP